MDTRRKEELFALFEEKPCYKEAYYEFLEVHKRNQGSQSTVEQLAEFETYFAMDFLNGVKNDSSERMELIRGKRLVIRRANIADAELMHSVELDEDNSPWVGSWPLGFRIAKFGDRDFLQTIIEKEDGTPVGFIIFRDMVQVKERMELKRIAITEKGKGYGREALRLAQKLAFEVFGTKYLYLGTKAENLRAQAVYRQTGFLPDMPDPCTQFHISLEDYKAERSGV